MLTLLLSLIWWFDGINSGIQSILFISALHLIIYAGKIRDTHAPIVDIVFLFTGALSQTKINLEKVKADNTVVDYTIPEKTEDK